MLTFDESALKENLERIEPKRRALFAAISATRISAAYQVFANITGRGNPVILNGVLDIVWSSLGSDGLFIKDEIDHAIRNVLELVPNEDDNWVPLCAQADDAAAAAAYSLRCLLTCAPQEAACAARRVYETVDNIIINLPEMESNEFMEEMILGHPAMQRELQQQQEDLTIAYTPLLNLQNLIQIRERSLQIGRDYFTPLLTAV